MERLKSHHGPVSSAQKRLHVLPMLARKHMTRRPEKSDKPDDNPVTRTGQAGKRDAGFAARFAEALAGRERAWLARETGISTSTIHDYAGGAIPSADRAFVIADALGVDPRWLVTGSGESTAAKTAEHFVQLPYYDIRTLGRDEISSPETVILLPRTWARSLTHTSAPLWLTTMPTDMMPEVAREGEPIICANFEGSLIEGGTYLVRQASGLITVRVAAVRHQKPVFLTSLSRLELVEKREPPEDAQTVIEMKGVIGRMIARLIASV